MNIKLILLVMLAFLGLGTANAQIGIGTSSPDASAQLELQSTAKGFLPPRMDTDARNNINSPADGLTIYNTDEKCLQWYNGSGWFNACDGSLFVPAGPISDCVSGFIPPFLSADDTAIVDVTNPVTNQTWMDRNLGAYTADRTPLDSYSDGGTDCWSYGNLYQWGRGNDGHESRLLDCATGDCFDAGGVNTSLPSTAADVTGSTWAGKFIYKVASPYDWHNNNPDNALWTSTGGTNNPCPSGYRVPTLAEWEAEWDSWDGNLDGTTPPSANNNSEGAITSPLKLPVAGYRSRTIGGLVNVGSDGDYWSSTVSGGSSEYSQRLNFDSSSANMYGSYRVSGHSVRCIKD